MRTLAITLFCLVWISIGLGVSVAYGERYKKDLKNEDRVSSFLLAVLWPGMIAADAYRASYQTCDPS